MVGYGGFYFGIGGVVIYKKFDLLEVFKKILCEKLLLEIDVFYLFLVFYCGKCNESVYFVYIVEKVVGIFGLLLVELCDLMIENVLWLFFI